MKFTVFNIMSSLSIPFIPTLGVVALAVLVSNCGGGGKVTDTGGRSQSGGVALRPIPVEFSTKSAVNYGPYRTATVAGSQYQTDPADATKALLVGGKCVPNPADRANEVLTDAQILEDLQLLTQAGFGVIRLFESSDNVAQRILRVIKANDLNLKVVLGAAIDNYVQSAIGTTCGIPTSDVANAAEIARTIKLANDYYGIVVAVSVGNEKMMDWATTPVATTKIAAYITQVRSQIKQPVTADENWGFYAHTASPDQPVNVILGAVDFVSMHTYPVLDTIYSPKLWDWRQKTVSETARADAMMTAAVESAKNEYTKVRAFLDSKSFEDMPVIIGETGWKARDYLWGRGPYDFRAHPVNQWMYLKKLTDWAKTVRDTKNADHIGLPVIYFDAFDEPWKQSDDKWGLFDVKRHARYAIQQLKPSVNWTIETVWAGDSVNPYLVDDGRYTDANAVYWSEPIVNTAVNASTYSRYTLYADSVTDGELIARGLDWNPWDKTKANKAFAGSGTQDGSKAIEFVPNPSTWGWGMFFGAGANSSVNLSQFANGHLQFDVKTNGYPGSLEFGFVTNSADNVNIEAYKALSSGMDGYVADGAWHHVSIPIADLLKGNVGDLSMVMHAFVIADRFAYTGKTTGTTGLPNVYVDRIYISKD